MPTDPVRAFAVLALLLPAAFSLTTIRAEEQEAPPKLLGRCTMQDLERQPFVVWFRPGYDGYEPRPETLARLRGLDLDGVDFQVFFGTWCGDSRREVPRLLELFDAMGLPPAQVALIAVDSTDGSLKRSPGGEERGLGIYRVPTVIVRRDGREIGRIVEHPVFSLERDLLAILSGEEYVPSYHSYPIVRGWFAEGLLADDNVSPRGLAEQLRHKVSGEGELAAAARVMLLRGDVAQAVKLYRVNCELFRDSARCWAQLAEALIRAGEPDDARDAAERALSLNTDEDYLEELLELIDRTRPAESSESSER